jgi:hypothetical protein
VPAAVLVNHQTAASAEALAAVLRQTGAGLILGSRTAGQATGRQDFPLKNGQRLRVATATIRLADGTALTADGLEPDIAVAVSPEDERSYFEDAFAVLERTNLLASSSLSLTNPANGTNRAARRPRISEAELVRLRREGADAEDSPARDAEPQKPQVKDPALARALDLLKGLAVVRPSRS